MLRQTSYSEADLLSAGATCCYIYTLHASNDPECRPRYVGFTVNPKKRDYAHNSSRERGRKAMWAREVRSRGFRVILTVVHQFRSDDLVERGVVEASWITFYRQKFSDLLNDSGGGQGVAKCSDWMRAKITRLAKIRGADPKFRAKMSEVLKQRYADPEARARQGETRKRVWANPEIQQKWKEENRRRCADPKHREKLSKAVKLAWKNPEYRKKINANKGRYSDPEYRAKLSTSKKRACADPQFRSKMSEILKQRYARKKLNKTLDEY